MHTNQCKIKNTGKVHEIRCVKQWIARTKVTRFYQFHIYIAITGSVTRPYKKCPFDRVCSIRNPYSKHVGSNIH